MLSTARIAETGLPAVAVVTESFADLAYRMREHNNHPDMPVLVLPYPLEDEPEDYLRDVARSYYPELLALLGASRG